MSGGKKLTLRKLSQTYDGAFYATQAESSYVSALNLLPNVFDSLPPIKTLLDVGCGVGAWLKAARDVNPTIEVIGIDHPGVDAGNLLVSPAEFIGRDLTQSFHLKKRFDLVMSLEVAEHLPDTSADTFVENLVRHSSMVLFSAAVPGQGGTSHVNEQWPHYWIMKFAAHGYRCYDFIRPMIWDDEKIQFWYRQNTFLFSTSVELAPHHGKKSDWAGHSVVHPACLDGGLGLKASVTLLAKSLARRFGQRHLIRL